MFAQDFIPHALITMTSLPGPKKLFQDGASNILKGPKCLEFLEGKESISSLQGLLLQSLCNRASRVNENALNVMVGLRVTCAHGARADAISSIKQTTKPCPTCRLRAKKYRNVQEIGQGLSVLACACWIVAPFCNPRGFRPAITTLIFWEKAISSIKSLMACCSSQDLPICSQARLSNCGDNDTETHEASH